MVAQEAVNFEVLGSNPSVGARNYNILVVSTSVELSHKPETSSLAGFLASDILLGIRGMFMAEITPDVKVNYNDGRPDGKEVTPEPTYGDLLVGRSFNPAGSARVDRLKSMYAAIIDELNDIRESYKDANDGEGVRHASIAITEAQGAQMWAVKSATWGL